VKITSLRLGLSDVVERWQLKSSSRGLAPLGILAADVDALGQLLQLGQPLDLRFELGGCAGGSCLIYGYAKIYISQRYQR